MIAAYADRQAEAESALQERQYRRRRMLAGIRGSLRLNSSPRLLTAFCFLASAVPGAAIGFLASWLGLSPWTTAPALSILAMWPVFIFICWRTSGYLFEKIPILRNFEANLAHDNQQTAEENARSYGPKLEDDFSSGIRSGWQQGLQQGMRQGAPGAGLIALIIIALATAGTWLVWQLIGYGPTLFTEMVFDGCLAKKYPGLDRKAATEPCLQNVFAATAVHFIGLIIVAILLGAILSCIPTTGWGKP